MDAGVEHTGAHFPLERYQTYSAHSSVSLNSRRRGQQVNDIRKPKTMFYNKVAYSNFDIVLHPEITEPPVQFTYNLKIQCQLPEGFKKKDAKEIVKQKYIWMTPEGSVKEIALP